MIFKTIDAEKKPKDLWKGWEVAPAHNISTSGNQKTSILHSEV
jgi:hypothetical protein